MTATMSSFVQWRTLSDPAHRTVNTGHAVTPAILSLFALHHAAFCCTSCVLCLRAAARTVGVGLALVSRLCFPASTTNQTSQVSKSSQSEPVSSTNTTDAAYCCLRKAARIGRPGGPVRGEPGDADLTRFFGVPSCDSPEVPCPLSCAVCKVDFKTGVGTTFFALPFSAFVSLVMNNAMHSLLHFHPTQYQACSRDVQRCAATTVPDK